MLSFARGSLVIGRRLPVAFHWSVPVGALVLGGFEPRPWFWLAFLALTIVHELGHALLVWRFGLRVVGIDVHGLGGTCHWRGGATPLEEAAIAWGGVLAEAMILVATLVVRLVAGPPTELWSAELYTAFTQWNLTMIAINLLPFPPLDGATAWRIVPLLRDRAARRARGEPARSVSDELRRRLARKGGDVFEVGRPPSERERRTLAEVDAEIRDIVERQLDSDKKRWH